MCFVDLEPCTIWREDARKARKEHRCSCCGRAIRAGETYLVHFSVFEGNAESQKMCRECEADRDEFAKAHDGTLCTPADLDRMLRSCIGEGGDDDAKWIAMRERIRAR